MQIVVDVTDWDEEYMQEEPNLGTKEDLIRVWIERGYHPAKLARMYIAARERRQAEADLIPCNKSLLMTGGSVALSRIGARQIERVQLTNGQEIHLRALVGSVRARGEEEEGEFQAAIESDEDEGMVTCRTQEALRRARAYLENMAPSIVYGRLKIVAANGGDVTEALEVFREKVEALAKKLM